MIGVAGINVCLKRVAVLAIVGMILSTGVSALAQNAEKERTANFTVDLAGSDYNGSYDCKGGNARISGDNNDVTLRRCRIVVVPGNDNNITTLTARTLKILGNGNVLEWSSRSTPVVDDTGSANSIVRGDGAS